MHISDLISELQRFQRTMGDLRVVLNDGLGSRVDSVYWDEDDNDETVLVVGD